MPHYDCSRPFTETGTNRHCAFNFLLVFHCSTGSLQADSAHLALTGVSGRLAPFYVHQMNQVNCRNGFTMMTAP